MVGVSELRIEKELVQGTDEEGEEVVEEDEGVGQVEGGGGGGDVVGGGIGEDIRGEEEELEAAAEAKRSTGASPLRRAS